MATTSDLHAQACAVLQMLTGNPEAQFREGQWDAIDALLTQRAKVLVVQRTGWGKSAVYFVATALTRAAGAGPTLLLSPLLSLMRDQIAAAARAGITAVSMNSANAQEWATISAQLAADDVDVLLVSPERLNNPRFRDEQLPTLIDRCGLIVIDEAHCISDWGHDFRPDYRRIRQILGELPTDLPVLATTATANSRVVTDVSEQLGVHGAQVLTIRGGLARQSLRCSVVQLASDSERLAWLMSNLTKLPGSGIVYTLSVSATEDVAAALRSAGLAVAAYSGRTDATERAELEEALRTNELKALVATSALGMGFDKPDLGFVVHLGAPPSPVAYYQQIGRAGRALDSADVVLLPTQEQHNIWQYFATASMPDEATCNIIMSALAEAGTAVSVPQLETKVPCSRSKLELMLKTLAVDGAVQRTQGGWLATGHNWVYDHDRYERVAQARRREQDAMLHYQQLTTCRMQFLQELLDDVAPSPCGRCDNCAGQWASTSVDQAVQQHAATQLNTIGVELEPRKQWPSGMANFGIALKGKIAPQHQIEPGRALGRFTDLGIGQQLRELLTTEAGNNQSAPHWLLDACVTVLAHWTWRQRPGALVVLPDEQHNPLLADVARNLARVGQLELLDPLHDTRPHDVVQETNSAFQVRDYWERYQIRATLASQVQQLTTPVLLLSAVCGSGWDHTVVGQQLRSAGACAVLPLALGRRA